MRKIILAAVLLLSCLFADAQGWDYGPRFEINGGYSLAPFAQAERFNTGWINSGTLGSIFRPYNSEIKMTGAFCVEFGIRTSRRWTISLMTSYNHVFSSKSVQAYKTEDGAYVSMRSSNVNGNNIAFIPRWRFDYIIKPGFRMYSSFGFGYGFYFNYSTDEEFYYEQMQAEAQLVPLGISFGKKWFGLVETGIGTQYMGGRIGFGYRF